MSLKELLKKTPTEDEALEDFKALQAEVIKLLNKLAEQGKLGSKPIETEGEKTPKDLKFQLEYGPEYERHPSGNAAIRPIGKKGKTWEEKAREVNAALTHFLPRFGEYIGDLMAHGFTDTDIVDALLCTPAPDEEPNRRISLHNVD